MRLLWRRVADALLLLLGQGLTPETLAQYLGLVPRLRYTAMRLAPAAEPTS